MLTLTMLIVTVLVILSGLVMLAAYGCCAASGRAEREYERQMLAAWQAEHDRLERERAEREGVA